VKAIAVKTDVGVEKEVKEAVDTAVKEFGRLDVMVCALISLPAMMTFMCLRP
jgi:NAD(P)-dependent dehydrogenase (short-subunit alcohol dehydrogenase family)